MVHQTEQGGSLAPAEPMPDLRLIKARLVASHHNRRLGAPRVERMRQHDLERAAADLSQVLAATRGKLALRLTIGEQAVWGISTVRDPEREEAAATPVHLKSGDSIIINAVEPPAAADGDFFACNGNVKISSAAMGATLVDKGKLELGALPETEG